MLFSKRDREPVDLHQHPSRPPPQTRDPRGRSNKENKNPGLRKATPVSVGKQDPGLLRVQQSSRPEQPLREKSSAWQGQLPVCQEPLALLCHLTTRGPSGWTRQLTPGLPPSRPLHLHPAFLRRKLRLPAAFEPQTRCPSAYLLPAQQFLRTLHFPDVSSFVAVSWYQLQELLRRCVTPSSSFSLLAGPS